MTQNVLTVLHNTLHYLRLSHLLSFNYVSSWLQPFNIFILSLAGHVPSDIDELKVSAET